MGLSNVTAPELIKISEELVDSRSLLLAVLSQFGDDVLNVIWLVLLDVNARDSGLGLGVVVEGVIVSPRDSEELVC